MRRANFLPAFLLALALSVLLRAVPVCAWSFAFTSDSHDDATGLFARILAVVDDSDMEFLVHGGDMVDRNTEEEWERFRKTIAAFGKPLRPVIGNHELYNGGTREAFAARFGLPGTTWSFTHENARFWMLDDAGGTLPDRLLARLDRELEKHPKGKDGIAFLVVAMHIPPALGGIAPHGTRPGYVEQSGKLLRILKKHGVDAILCGHEHTNMVEDLEGIPVIVSGVARIPLLPFARTGFYRIDLERGTLRPTFVPVEPPAGKKPPAKR